MSSLTSMPMAGARTSTGALSILSRISSSGSPVPRIAEALWRYTRRNGKRFDCVSSRPADLA